MPYNSPDQSAPNLRAKEAQLIISLKFHYGKTLAELPLDVAVDAMVKVWESCNPHVDKSQQPGLMTSQPRKVSASKSTPPNPQNIATKTIHL